jgi:NAD(P)H-dependent FMN reductase
MPTIKVIVGSTRPGRFGIQPAEWIMDLAKSHTEARFELVDLAEVNLPLLDEPVPAIHGKYENDHTKAWSKIIDEADGFVIVTPEYNHSVPAALKNAIDYLAQEWRYKPVTFVSYGTEAGGTRAVEHFRAGLANLSMFDLRDHVTIPNFWLQQDESGKFTPNEYQQTEAQKMLESIVFWTGHLKPAREALRK